MKQCKCKDCGIEFEYEFEISICDNCLDKYKKKESVKKGRLYQLNAVYRPLVETMSAKGYSRRDIAIKCKCTTQLLTEAMSMWDINVKR